MYKMKDKSNYMFNPNKPEDKADLALDLSSIGPEDEDADEPEKFKWSKDGKFMSFTTTSHGSDWKKIRVVNLNTGKEIKDVIDKVKFSDASWDPNSKGFFYGRFDSTEEKQLKYVGSDPQELPHQKVYYHTIGTPQEEDKLIYEDPENKEQAYSITKTHDGQYLKMTITKGTDPKSLVSYVDISKNQDFSEKLVFKPLISEWKANFDFIHNVGTKFFYVTNDNSPSKRIISLDINFPQEENWREIIRGDE